MQAILAGKNARLPLSASGKSALYFIVVVCNEYFVLLVLCCGYHKFRITAKTEILLLPIIFIYTYILIRLIVMLDRY